MNVGRDWRRPGQEALFDGAHPAGHLYFSVTTATAAADYARKTTESFASCGSAD